MITKEEEKLPFTIPKETSWHFERKLKPDDKTVGNYVLIQPGAADIVKVLQAYSHHPVPAYNIASIEIMYNEQLNRLFYGHMKMMNNRKGNLKYVPSWKNTAPGEEKQWREETHAQLKQLSAAYRDADMSNIMILPLWHGSSDDVSDYIFNMGYGIFTSNDPKFVTDEGFFGKGVYTAHEAEYAFRSYAKKHGNKAVLLLNWVSIFEAYPVIDGDMPKLQGKMGGYDQCDAHFIPVRSDLHPHTDTYYPCAQDQAQDYHEIVVFTPAQCLPRYRVKLIQSAPQPGIDDAASVSHQMALDCLGLGQYAMVGNAFEDAASAGHPGAVIRLHWLHSGSSGVIPADMHEWQKYQTLPKSSLEFLKHKANFRGENDQESQFNLAWCYQHGLGVELNLAKAAQYYWVAAVQGHRDAQYQLGICCAAGIGVKQDMRKAIVYYEQAATQGHVQAHYVLSQCYESGLGIASDAKKSLEHKQAAQKGNHPKLAGVGLASLTPTTNTEDKKTIVRLEQTIKQQKDISDQDKRKINELTQAVSAGKQASRTKDETIAGQKQEKDEIIAKKEAELRDKEEALQRQTGKASTLSSKLSKKEGELKAKLSEIDELKSALAESKDRENRLKMQFQEYQKQPQSPAPPLPPMPQKMEQFSRFFPPNPSAEPLLLNAQQQEKQNQLVAALLKSDLVLVKQMESQGASLLYPNQEGLYPLVAAVYGCSLETVRYVELKLKEEAGKQWAEVDGNKAKENLTRWIPTDLSANVTYGEVGNWYVKYQGASWCAFYDSECLKKHGFQNWGGWDGWYREVKWDKDVCWNKEGARARWHKGKNEKYLRISNGRSETVGSGEGNRLLSPSVKVHEDVVHAIREQLNELRNFVETKVKQSSAAVFNF
jgi:TPR repeat protein